jgi:hypothetical protein
MGRALCSPRSSSSGWPSSRLWLLQHSRWAGPLAKVQGKPSEKENSLFSGSLALRLGRIKLKRGFGIKN